MAGTRARRDALGSILGLATFLGGIGLLLLTFKLAYDLFNVPPDRALQLERGKPIDLAVAGSNVTGIVLRILLLAVMGFVSSLIANRGIHMYTESRRPLDRETHTERTVEVRQAPEQKPQDP